MLSSDQLPRESALHRIRIGFQGFFYIFLPGRRILFGVVSKGLHTLNPLGDKKNRLGAPGSPVMKQPCLLFNGKLFPVPAEEEFVLGRDAVCHLVITDSRVSRRHARVTVINGRYVIRDLGSMNGTFVNGERLRDSAVLLPGDEVLVPPHKMLFVLSDAEEQPSQRVPGKPVAAPKSHFAGILRALRLTDLIQLLNATMQSGMLTIHDGRNNEGHIRLNQGEIDTSEFMDKKGDEAVFAMLALKEGEFEFAQGDPIAGKVPEKRTMSLLLEGCRLADEASSKTQSIRIR